MWKPFILPFFHSLHLSLQQQKSAYDPWGFQALHGPAVGPDGVWPQYNFMLYLKSDLYVQASICIMSLFHLKVQMT